MLVLNKQILCYGFFCLEIFDFALYIFISSSLIPRNDFLVEDNIKSLYTYLKNLNKLRFVLLKSVFHTIYEMFFGLRIDTMKK